MDCSKDGCKELNEPGTCDGEATIEGESPFEH